MKTVAIIQARMASTRLPGKIMMDLAGKPLLEQVVRRAQRAKPIDLVVVATSDRQADDVVAQFCLGSGIACFRGSEDDVLDRFYQTAKHFDANIIVRLTADCPLLDPDVVDQVIRFFESGRYDYVSNFFWLSYPDGLDSEVFSWQTLERAWKEANLKSEREHVTPYIWKQPNLFRLGNVKNDLDLSALRWTVDEPCDLEFVRQVYGYLSDRPSFGIADVLEVLREHPDLNDINQGIRRNEGYAKSLQEDSAAGGAEVKMSGMGRRLYAQAKMRIPGGTQLLSKRPEMFLPDQWPSYYSKAKGVEVWDLDGNKYVDMSYNGIGACILGAADPEVDAAVKNAIDNGSMSTLNVPEEVELAELLCELHLWSEMVRYARSGGEAMAMAVRIARAKTRRDRVAFCGYHGWHDWYLAANLAGEQALDGHLLPGLEPAGVPRGLIGTALPFRYNHIEELKAIVTRHKNELAAIVMEPIRDHDPEPGFLEEIREIANSIGAVLVFDEITAGFRLNTGGAHLLYHVEPDIAVFAKAMSNGYPMAAILGRADVMQAAQTTFISSTYWTDRIGPSAALATIRKHRRENVATHLMRMGKLVQDGWKQVAQRAGLQLEVGGIFPLGHFAFIGEQKQAARTLFTQIMLERGFLATGAFYATFAHQDQHVEGYLESAEDAFKVVAQALATGSVIDQLRGPVAHTGFTRLT